MPVSTGSGGIRQPDKIGGSNTYVYADETNDAVQVYVNGQKVHEWS